MLQNVTILRAHLYLLNELPDDGIHDMPKHVGDILTCMYFGACKVGFADPSGSAV